MTSPVIINDSIEPPGSPQSSPRIHFEISLANVTDASVLATLGSAAWTGAFAWSVSESDRDSFLNQYYTPRVWEGELTNPASEVYVARSSSSKKILGFVQLKRGTTDPCLKNVPGSMIELQRLYVSPESQGMGVGKALLNHADEVARKEEFESMWLGVWEHSTDAYRLYMTMGYRKIGGHDFAVGHTTHRDWVLIKSL